MDEVDLVDGMDGSTGTEVPTGWPAANGAIGSSVGLIGQMGRMGAKFSSSGMAPEGQGGLFLLIHRRLGPQP